MNWPVEDDRLVFNSVNRLHGCKELHGYYLFKLCIEGRSGGSLIFFQTAEDLSRR
jgi:hypothetical protein